MKEEKEEEVSAVALNKTSYKKWTEQTHIPVELVEPIPAMYKDLMLSLSGSGGLKQKIRTV